MDVTVVGPSPSPSSDVREWKLAGSELILVLPRLYGVQADVHSVD